MRRYVCAAMTVIVLLTGTRVFGMWWDDFEKKDIGVIFTGDPGEECSVSPRGSWLASVAPARAAEPIAIFDIEHRKKIPVSVAGEMADFSMVTGTIIAWQSEYELMVAFSLPDQTLVYDIKVGTARAMVSRIETEGAQRFFSGVHKHTYGTTIRTPDDAASLSDSPLRNGAFGITAQEADSGRSLYLFYQEKKIATYLQTTGLLSFNKPLLTNLSVPLFVLESWQKHPQILGAFYTVSWVTTGLHLASSDLYYFSIQNNKVSLLDKDVAGLMMWAPDARSFFYAKKDAQGTYHTFMVSFRLPQGPAAPRAH